jgi:hypothetical protein
MQIIQGTCEGHLNMVSDVVLLFQKTQ